MKKQTKSSSKFLLFKYIGPGFIVTVGFIDPGNWATNIAAGAQFGYTLLWVVLLSTIMLIILQINSSKLGIVTGECLAEATTKHFSKYKSRIILATVFIAIIATLVAELLGSAIALNMLFQIPIKYGTLISAVVVMFFVLTNSYRKIERVIIGMVALIAFCFVFELFIVNVDVSLAIYSTLVPRIPTGAMIIVMGVMGAVIMPHNLFLHSEFVQSRTIDPGNEIEIKAQIEYSKKDSLLAMGVGFIINAAILILAASTFYIAGVAVTDFTQTGVMLEPILGNLGATVFAIALLLAGIASSITAVMSAGVVTSGMVSQSFNPKKVHTKIGMLVCVIIAAGTIFLIKDPFYGLIISQVVLSIQLPITIITLIKLTNNRSIMKNYANTKRERATLYLVSTIVIFLNILLLISVIVN